MKHPLPCSFGLDSPCTCPEPADNDDWQASRWWRVIAPDGLLWCETSDEQEARNLIREGDILEQLYTRTENRWVPEVTDQ